MPAKLSISENTPTDSDTRTILAWNVRRLRVKAGWSQEEVAIRSGLDRTYVSSLERKVWNVSLSNIDKLAKALGVEAWVLLSPEDKLRT